jgi:hypothetical protein
LEIQAVEKTTKMNTAKTILSFILGIISSV